MSELESVRNGWDWKVSEIAQIGKCQRLLGLESVRIGKCQKLLKLERVRNGSNLNVSETAQIGMCQKLLRLESVRNFSDWKVSELYINDENWALLRI